MTSSDDKQAGGLSRRGFLGTSGLLAGAGLTTLHAAPSGHLQLGPDIYESIGVTPIVNCRGTFTIISGSQTLPEVKAAMDAASRHYIHLDELMDAVSRRLAELTQAEWGIVTAGCAAALTHATAACIAGADPEKMQRLPNLSGLKNEVVVPRHSRNEYDHAVRMLGVRMVEVDTPEQMIAALNDKTAMVMVLASPEAERSPLNVDVVCQLAKQRNVPVIVDAAAETLTIPNKYLQRGATMVAYSGGKCLRGPQCSGLLLGRKDLVQAAWINSAPHHAFGRSLKVGKEEIMGLLAAVEMWVKRDHDAEWKTWQSWLDSIAARVTAIPGVTTEILQPSDLSNHAPRLRILWDAAKLGITGQQVEQALLHGSPRIVFNESSAGSLTVMPYMMMPDDHKIAGDAIRAILTKPPKFEAPTPPSAPVLNVDGLWEAELTFVCGTARHQLQFEQRGDQLLGSHHGDVLAGDLRGSVDGATIHFRSGHHYEGTTLHYDFTGTVDGADGRHMSGEVTLGEYGKARWTAQRHSYA